MKGSKAMFAMPENGDNSAVLPGALVQKLRDKLSAHPADESRWEFWKYTPLTPLLQHRWLKPVPTGKKPPAAPTPEGFTRLELNDGTEQKAAMEADAFSIKASGEMLASTPDFQQLINTALHRPMPWFEAHNIMHFTGGYGVRIHKGETAKLHLANIATQAGVGIGVRHLLHIGDHSAADLILSFDAGAEAFVNSGATLSVGKDAQLNLFVIQPATPALLLNTIDVAQMQGSTVNIYCFTDSNSWVRNNIRVEHRAPHCFTRINGLFSVHGQGHVDNHTWIEHRHPDGESHELFRGIVRDKATGVFNGRVHVHRDAQRTNAFQQNNNILLGTEARVNTKPELEIYADDVKCSHGTTTGQLDNEAMFYLRSRGIPEPDARRLLIRGFADTVFEPIRQAPMHGYFSACLDALNF